MIISSLTYEYYITNIMYEDYDGYSIKFMISTNINDFAENKERVTDIKLIFIEMLNEHLAKKYTSVNEEVPKYIREYILEQIMKI